MFESLGLPIIALVIGLVLLIKSSDYFIVGAASTAIHLNISSLIIGVVVLGFGTSMPEIIVSALSAIDESPNLAVGNVVGSNIANIGLVLACAAIVYPVVVKSSILRREIPILLAISFGSFLLVLDFNLDIVDGFILLLTLVFVMFWIVRTNRSNSSSSEPLRSDIEKELKEIPKESLKKSLIFLISGLLVLMLSAKIMVWSAVEIANFFKVPEVVIGLTIVAIGTSLPELAASISAAVKKESELLLGNILGSNLFNILAALAMPAIIYPFSVDSDVVRVDYPIMLFFTLALLMVVIPRKGQAKISSVEGGLLLFAYFSYLVFLYYRTVF